MREPEAARYLGVSTQTLYRYRKAGKLPFRELAGPTRPIIDYADADLERLKTSLEVRRRRSKKPSPAGQSAPRVTFGLPTQEFEELRGDAARYGLRVGEYARRLVREGLESSFRTEAAELRDQVKSVNAELKTLREDVASGLEALLEYVGLSPEEAQQWVTDNVR